MKTSFQPNIQKHEIETCKEIELLLYCARTHIDNATADYIKTLLEKDINWEYLIKLAHQHRVATLLYRSLHATCPEAVAKAVLDMLIPIH